MVWTSTVASAVLLLAGLIGVVAWQADRPEDATAPQATTADGLGLPVGTGPVIVDVYLDFLCPACKQFHDAARSTLDGYVADGTVTLVYRPIAILDRLTTTGFSTRAGAAAGCAADGGAIDGFVAAMMAHQPPEGSAGLSDDQIVQIGAGAGLTAPDFGECVRGGSYRDWVDRTTDAASDRGVTSTPTVFVDGERVELSSLDGFVAAVEAARR
jgi:protein-disulfide isomerase